MNVGPAKSPFQARPRRHDFRSNCRHFCSRCPAICSIPRRFRSIAAPLEHRIGGRNGLSRRHRGGNSARDVNDLRPAVGRSGTRRRPIRRAAARSGKFAVSAPWAVNHCSLKGETHFVIGTVAADSHLRPPVNSPVGTAPMGEIHFGRARRGSLVRHPTGSTAERMELRPRRHGKYRRRLPSLRAGRTLAQP
jgi:hypothetical protein